MALAKVSPLYPKINTNSDGTNPDQGEFADRYNVARQYILHIIKIINGTCSQKTRYRNLIIDVFVVNDISLSKIVQTEIEKHH